MKRVCIFSVSLLLIMCLLLNGPLCALAASDNSSDVADLCAIESSPIVMVDIMGNQYGRADWPSLSAAKSYYGYDFNYSSCSVFYSGLYFNYYYNFDDGTSMFFGVKL